MKSAFIYFAILSIALSVSAQEGTAPPPDVRKPVPATVVKPLPAKPSTPASTVKEAEAPRVSTRSSFQDRIKTLSSRPDDPREVGGSLTNNYRIKVDYLINGKSSSFSILTGRQKLRYQGMDKGTEIDGIKLPSSIDFEGQLFNETESTISLDYFLGRTVPYVTGTYTRPDGGKTASQFQQMQVGISNGSTFHFGKPVKVVESDGEMITITIEKTEHP